MLRLREANKASARSVAELLPTDVRLTASARLLMIRRAVREICGGLSKGDMCARMTGTVSTAKRGARKDGPPVEKKVN